LAPATNWAKHSPGDNFWTFAIILILLTVGGFIGAFYFFLRKRIIEDTPLPQIYAPLHRAMLSFPVSAS
ncbi:MAG: hypothetical protein ACE1ZG_06035, partial [Gammaproteobacteria bacterium]